MALNTHRQFAINNENVARSTEKLSSGYRINRAGDDAAGLAISEKMRAQIRGLGMASKNSQDAISLIQTAEGALTETHAILQRMSELATQSSSDTNQNGVDRNSLQSEFSQLSSEIDDIATKTSFNNALLLNGSFGSTAATTVGSEVKVGTANVLSIDFSGFSAGAGQTITFTRPGAAGTAYTATLAGASGGASIIAGVANTAGAQSISLDFGSNRKVTITTNASFAQDVLQVAGTDTITFDVTGNTADIQTGANQGDTMQIQMADMRASALGLGASSVATKTGAQSAITAVQTAINTVSSQRATLGSYQNRLQHKISNLDTASENLQAAESRIRDLDMASEMTTFTKNNILVQAATAMLAQANSAPQGVLQLLK